MKRQLLCPLTFLLSVAGCQQGPTSIPSVAEVAAGDGFTQPNLAPLANAGESIVLGQGLLSGAEVQLDGTASLDPEGAALSHLWRQTIGPRVELRGAETSRPFFDAPRVDAKLVFELEVSDGHLSSVASVSVMTLAYGGISAVPVPGSLGAGHTLEGRTQAVEVAGGRAFVSTYEGAVHVLDVGDPLSPVLLETYTTPGQALDMMADQGVLYIADGHHGLHTLSTDDVSELGSSQTFSNAVKVVVRGDRAYLAGRHMGLTIMDVSDPSAPAQMSQRYINGLAQDLAVDGEWVFMAAGHGGFVVVNVRDGIEPVAQLPTSTLALAVEGRWAYGLTSGGHLTTIDLSNPAEPRAVGDLPLGDTANDIVVFGQRAFVAMAGEGVCVVDISDPARPVIIRRVETPGIARGLAISRGTLFVADSQGLVTMDLDQLGGSWLDRREVLDVEMNDMVVSGRLAFIGSDDGLRVMDLSEPTEPVLVGRSPSSHPIERLVRRGDRLFCLQPFGAVLVMDVSNPSAPEVVGYKWRHERHAGDLAVDASGSVMVVSGGARGVEIFDVAQGVRWISSVDTGGSVSSVSMRGSMAYLGDEAWGVFAVNLSEPSAPVVVDVYDPLARVNDLEVYSDTLYVAQGDGLEALTIAEDGGFSQTSRLEAERAVLRLALVGGGIAATQAGGLVTLYSALSDADGVEVSARYLLGEATLLASSAGVRYLSGEGGEMVIAPVPSGLSSSGGGEVVGGQPLVWALTDLEPGLKIGCAATAGSCEVLAHNRTLNEAIVRLLAPGEPGDHEVVFYQGDHRFFEVIGRDRVFVR